MTARRILLPLWVLLSALPGIASADHYHLMIQEFAPFTNTDPKSGEIRGMVTEKIQEILRRSGDTYKLSSTSLARGLNAVQHEDNTCLFAFRRTPERESFFRWVGPLATDTWVLYSRKDDTRVLKKIEDAKPYAIGSYKNAATGLQLTEQGYNIKFASQDEDNPRLLINHRIDYWIVSELHGLYMAQQQGYGDDIVKAIRYKHIELNMLCNLNIDKQKIEQWNRINKELDSDGSTEKLLRKYGMH